MNSDFEGLQEVKVEAALEELGRQRVPVVKDAVRKRPRHPLGAAQRQWVRKLRAVPEVPGSTLSTK